MPVEYIHIVLMIAAITIERTSFMTSFFENCIVKPAVAILIVIIISIGGCGKYNYGNIFPLDSGLWNKAKKIPNAEAFTIKISPEEYKSIKETLSLHGFTKWEPLSSVYSGKFVLNKTSHGETANHPVLSINKGSRLQGVFPIIVYYQDAGLMYLVISDGMQL